MGSRDGPAICLQLKSGSLRMYLMIGDMIRWARYQQKERAEADNSTSSLPRSTATQNPGLWFKSSTIAKLDANVGGMVAIAPKLWDQDQKETVQYNVASQRLISESSSILSNHNLDSTCRAPTLLLSQRDRILYIHRPAIACRSIALALTAIVPMYTCTVAKLHH